jgi:hypothetical protein
MQQHKTMKLQHWRAFQAKNALEAAPVLEFVNVAVRMCTPSPSVPFPSRDEGTLEVKQRGWGEGDVSINKTLMIFSTRE